MLLLVGTTNGWIRGFLTMSCQWMVSAWHRNLLRSTYTPPFKISVETRQRRYRTGSEFEKRHSAHFFFKSSSTVQKGNLGINMWTMAVVTSVARTKPRHVALINNFQFLPFCCFSHPFLSMQNPFLSILSEKNQLCFDAAMTRKSWRECNPPKGDSSCNKSRC